METALSQYKSIGCFSDTQGQLTSQKVVGSGQNELIQNVMYVFVACKYNIEKCSFKSSENTHKKEGGPDTSVSKHQFASVIFTELTMEARESIT